jgi:hypothetical protein
MTFDVMSYVKYVKNQTEAYLTHVENTLTTKNPDFVKNILNNPELYNTDGTLRKDILPEVINRQVEALKNDPNFQDYEYNQELVEKMFLIDADLLKKFIIE